MCSRLGACVDVCAEFYSGRMMATPARTQTVSMATLQAQTIVMPAARLGPASPLVPLVGPTSPVEADNSMDEDDRRYFGYGQVEAVLPYWMQSDYDRVRQPRSFRTLVLENDVLRAVFLPELGGRLWSLSHKPSGRELLYTNPVFQPANLAIRDAWFSGGVEWNFGWRGHSPLTCSPVFAARAHHQGMPVLRLYEWERQRQMAYQIDAWLSPDAPVLYVRVRLCNPHPHEMPVYWWSNIAVPQTEWGRVLAPASQAFCHNYQGHMHVRSFPIIDGVDRSYPIRNDKASDFFYKIAPGRHPWIAAVDRDGLGLFQTSTSQLRGRKMFVWGSAPGGDNWQNFLSEPGFPYLEIQAGLAPTQSHCVPMPAGAEWCWLEAYGLVETSADRVHGSWPDACVHVEDSIDAVIGASKLEMDLKASDDMARRAPDRILQMGSGWGALERHRRQRADEQPFNEVATPFPDESLTDEQRPWRTLLDHGTFPQSSPHECPASWMTQPHWLPLLKRSLAEPNGDHWSVRLQLGVMHADRGDLDAAVLDLRRSVALSPSPWAYWYLGQVAAVRRNWDEAARAYSAAYALAPQMLTLKLAACRAWLHAGQPQHVMQILETLPASARERGEVVLLEGESALMLGDVERVRAILSSPLTVINLREGDTSVTSLWFRLHARLLNGEYGLLDRAELTRRLLSEYPPPESIDYRASWHDVRF